MVGSFVMAALVLAVLVMVPGPDVAVVTRIALSSGRRAGAQAAAGIAAGLLVWGTLTVAGLAAVLAASAEVYTVVKVTGAVYLVFLGIQTLWRTRGCRAEAQLHSEAGTLRGGPAWRTALTTNLLNPKIAVFYTGLLPQLVPRGAPVTVGLVGLVAVHVLLTLTWLNLYAALLQRARTALQRPRVRMVIDRFTGLVLIGFGLRVATQHD